VGGLLGIKTHSIPSLPFLAASLWPGEQARWWWSCHLLDLLSCWFHGGLPDMELLGLPQMMELVVALTGIWH